MSHYTNYIYLNRENMKIEKQLELYRVQQEKNDLYKEKDHSYSYGTNHWQDCSEDFRVQRLVKLNQKEELLKADIQRLSET